MKLSLIASALIFLSYSSPAQKAEVFQMDGAAIRGYDPVAFFKEQKPVKGSTEFKSQWKGATWFFTSKENMDAFSHSPEAYAPQYGGYCAYGTARGYKAPTQIDTWTIVNGKLYLNYNKTVKDLWSNDTPGYIRKADGHWPVIKNKG